MKRFLAVVLIVAGLAYLLWGATGVAVYIGTLLVWLLGVYCGYVGALHMPRQEQHAQLDAEQAQSIALAAARMALLQQDRRFS